MRLPLLPTTGVGSFPKPAYITRSAGYLDEKSRNATKEFIIEQEKMGFDVLVDGEFYRQDMASDYARALELPQLGWTRSYDNRFWKKPVVDKKLERRNPIQVDQYIFAQGIAKKPVKGMLTGPTTLANWSFNNYYGSREDLVFGWADVIRQEAIALQEAGAEYIQIDEPAVGERPWESELFNEGLRRSREGVNAYIITHVCYGDFPLVYPRMPGLPVDQIDIELSSELDLGKKSKILGMMKDDPLTRYKDVAVGVADVRPGVPTEDADTITRRINASLDVLAYNQDALRRIWIHPDCGFRTTKDPEIAYAKMKAMMEAVEKARKNIGIQMERY